jgi:hypothetical protein
MVKTTDDVRDITPLERMDRLEEIGNEKRGTIAAKKKELEEFEKSKKKDIEELDQKKKREIEDFDKRKQKDLEDLDAKRKELKDLETKKLKEIEETEELIETSFQELMRHKRIILQEEDDKDRKKNQASAQSKEDNLEDMTGNAPKISQDLKNVNYSRFFENMQAPQRLYDVTNNNFYQGLTGLRNKAASGEISPEEELFIQKLRGRFEQFTQNQEYLEEKDQNQYVRRSMNIIDQIDKYQRLKID